MATATAQATAPAAFCANSENGCVMFDCLVYLWDWIDPPLPETESQMENKPTVSATQQPVSQQHMMAHHVHPDQIYSQQPMPAQMPATQPAQIQPNGVMHQLLQSQYHSNMSARSPLLENRHELYGTGAGHTHDYTWHYGGNDNYTYPQTPPGRDERIHLHTDHNINHDILQNIPKGCNAEVYQDYMKRNPMKDTKQIYQNHQPELHKSNMNQYGSKPYVPYSVRKGPSSNTELLKRQYSEIQQMKLQQQMHYQSQAQMHQQKKFAERQILLQQLHGVQPPPNLQNSIYSEGSYRDLDRYGKNDFKQYSSTDIQKDVDSYAKNNEYKELEKQSKPYQETQKQQYQEPQWQSNKHTDLREADDRYKKQSEGHKGKSKSPPSDFNNERQKSNVGVVSPMKSSDSSSPSIKSPVSETRRSSSGQALRSPIAQRQPSAPVTMAGILYKQGSDGLKVWRKRWFVLSEYCLFYYKSQDEDKLLGSVLLPSYVVSACTAEDKVLRKFAFKLEHANMRTYVLAAPDQHAKMQWVKALTMAALMQSPNEQTQRQSERSAKMEDDDGPGPTYANAPPKPRRSNEGYNSPSPDMYDVNYDLLKQPSSHYSQGTSHAHYQDHSTYGTIPQEGQYTSGLLSQTQQYQPKRACDTQHLSLSLSNTTPQRLDNNQPSTSSMHRPNPPYFDDRERAQHYPLQDHHDKIQERLSLNPFLQEMNAQTETTPNDINLPMNRTPLEQDPSKCLYSESYLESRAGPKAQDANAPSKDVYGECLRSHKSGSPMNERLLIERRTPDAYGRSTSVLAFDSKGKDYEDVYSSYAAGNEYGEAYAKSSNPFQSRDSMSVSSQQPAQDYVATQNPEKTFSGPSVLRRKKMQSSGIQPPMPRPHSADFLEYEAKQEMLNKTMPSKTVREPTRQPPRPKSSLDINSYYDPSSDRYYSEKSYAEKMRQFAQYLQHEADPRNIQIPLAKYASGLAEKQLNSPYSQVTNNNYEMEFRESRPNRDNLNSSLNSKYSGDLEGLNSNWTLREKALESQRDYMKRSGSVMSDRSNASGFVKEVNRYDPQDTRAFNRSASARLPSGTTEKEGEKIVQQREESMKRLLEWKQRMLQSPLSRKSTPATISLARSLNQSRQSLRSDQYKPKSYGSANYTSYSSDDEEETTGTDLQKPREMQAGRSQRQNLTTPNILRPVTSPAPAASHVDALVGCTAQVDKATAHTTKNTYENVHCITDSPSLRCEKLVKNYENTCDEQGKAESVGQAMTHDDQDGYETHESEAESETQIEYTDNDLDEVLLESDDETKTAAACSEAQCGGDALEAKQSESNAETPPILCSGEDHYLPMSPRKTLKVEPAHKTILQNLSVFNQSTPHGYEDNPYVEMNLGNEEEDMQTYEIVCVNNGKVEPVYMELNNFVTKESDLDEAYISSSKFTLDTASNFADTKDLTLKRASKGDKSTKEKSDCSDADDEASKEISLEVPFSRFSISDNFRPASYYLGASQASEMIDSSDSEIIPQQTQIFTPICDESASESLSKYILDKLDQSDMPQENSILKMLTNENQTMNAGGKKASSMMYGGRTFSDDTLSRGEKIRISRASLTMDNKINDISTNVSINSMHNNYSSMDTDSLRSYNADRGSSQLSLESDTSSKFEMTQSNVASEISSLNVSEIIDFRYPKSFEDLEMMMKRRPLSDDSIFELSASGIPSPTENEPIANFELDRYLCNLQPSTSASHLHQNTTHVNCYAADTFAYKDNTLQAAQFHTVGHTRCSSTPASHTNNTGSSKNRQGRKSGDSMSGYVSSHSSCSSIGLAKSPISSYYSKDYDEEKMLSKNLNNDVMDDKIKEFDNDKLALKSETKTNSSPTATGLHSRESSTEHSAPYYYSDLSSQEHINLMPTSHYLKNTNLHRKLNNQRRRGPFHKKTDISHIHNPIHNSSVVLSVHSFDLAATARSVSVEFLTAADKDPEIDIKNINESSSVQNSKIPESMSLISGLGCKRNSSITNLENSSPDSNAIYRSGLNTSSTIKISNASMSSHCSGNSSNTVYYDAEAETSETHAYENVMCQGEKHWDEDTLWRDNLRRVSHRHARSMDDLDAVPAEMPLTGRTSADICGMNSIKRVNKKMAVKMSRNATYENCDIRNEVLREKEDCTSSQSSCPEEAKDDNDVYVSLVENARATVEQSDDGVYEQLAAGESPNSALTMQSLDSNKYKQSKNKRRFEIDREKLRQWDLMSSGLMKGEVGYTRDAGAGVVVGTGAALCSTDTGTDRASSEASMTLAGTKIDLGKNNSTQQTLLNKPFLGSNTSIGRNSRDTNIPVRAVSPRVRWVEEKQPDHYGSQQMSTSQQNLHLLNGNEVSWTAARSPSRPLAQQPIRAVSPRVRRSNENDNLQRDGLGEVPTAGELLGRTHQELVLLLIQLRRQHAATHRAIEQCCTQIHTIEGCLSSVKAMEREESLQRLEQLKMHLMELESQYEKSKPLVQLVDNMVKLGSLYNRPGSTMERLESNQRLRQKVLAEHAVEQQRWLESAAAGKPLETDAARARVAELWALEQELADEASILQGLRTKKDAIETLLTGVRGKLNTVPRADLVSPLGMDLDAGGIGAGAPAAGGLGPDGLGPVNSLKAELARVHAMLAQNSKKLEQTVDDNAHLERELQQLRRALQARRTSASPPSQTFNHPTAMLENEVSRVQQLVCQLQRQRQELSRAMRQLTHQSHALQITQQSIPGKRRPTSSWQETSLDTGHMADHPYPDYNYDYGQILPPSHHQYQPSDVETLLYVDTRAGCDDVTSPLNSEDMHNTGFGNLSSVEKQEIKTVRIVKRESERRQRDRERSLQPMSDWPATNVTASLDHFLEEDFVSPSSSFTRGASLPRTDFARFEEYYSQPKPQDPYLRYEKTNMQLSPKFPSSPSLSIYDHSRDISLSSSYSNYQEPRSGYERAASGSAQYMNSPTDSMRTLTNEPVGKTGSVANVSGSNMELSPIFKSEAAKQIITEMSGDPPRSGSLHRREVPKEKRRHNTAPHHLSAKVLNEMPKDIYNQNKMRRSLDDADMERALRTAPAPDVVRSALPSRYADSIDQMLAAPQKILIPERYIPEKPPELSPEERQKRLEKVESIKKMLSGSSADPSKSPEGEEKRQREHLLQMNQILAKQVTEMSKIIAEKALEELPQQNGNDDLDDRSPDVELPLYQQRDNYFT